MATSTQPAPVPCLELKCPFLLLSQPPTFFDLCVSGLDKCGTRYSIFMGYIWWSLVGFGRRLGALIRRPGVVYSGWLHYFCLVNPKVNQWSDFFLGEVSTCIVYLSHRSFMFIFTICFRACSTSYSVISYPTFLLMAGLIDAWRSAAFDLLVIACFIGICCQLVDPCVGNLKLTSVKVPSSRASDRSWVIILNLLFRIGTAMIVIWISTMSPTLNRPGSTSINLMLIFIAG